MTIPTTTARIRRHASSACMALLFLAGSLLLGGCATPAGHTSHPQDPLETWNRGVYLFNSDMDKMFVKPVATVYTAATPTVVQKGVRNFFSNLGDGWSAINSALQLKGQEAMNNFWRFTLNSTFGLGGLLDIATPAGIPQTRQDFGLTLAHWGVPSGPYLVLPLLGPSTLRDTVALPVDMQGNLVSAVDNIPVRNSLTGLRLLERRASLLETTDLVEQAALDPYSFVRNAWLQTRNTRATPPSDTADSTDNNDGRVADDSEGYAPPADDDGYVSPVDDSASDGYAPPVDDDSTHDGYAPPPPAAATDNAASHAAVPLPTPEQAPAPVTTTPSTIDADLDPAAPQAGAMLGDPTPPATPPAHI